MYKRTITFSLIIISTFLILASLAFLGIFSNINLKLTDELYGGFQPMNQIVIVAIDDKSLQEIGRWPWDRNNFTELIYKLDQAAVIGIDVGFFEPTTQDIKLGNAIKNNKKTVLTVEYTDFIKENNSIVGKDILLPVEEIKTDSNLGYVNIITDKDGITRRTNLDVKGKYKSFNEEIYSIYLGKDFNEKSNNFLINFVNKPFSFQQFSFVDVLNQNINFKDKIVLVGATSVDLHDNYFVPTSNGVAMPGVEVHANTIQTMLTKRFLKEQSFFSLILTILLFTILISFLVQKLGIKWAAISGLVIIFLYIILAILLFNEKIILNLIYPPITIFLTYTVLVGYNYLSESEAKKQLRNAFSRYVSPILVEEIIKDPEKLKLGGEKRNISILFSDLRNFTTLSESLTPEKLVTFLNEYLDGMTNIILENKGLVDKYIGDAIMAFWGAPLKEENDALLSCKAAIKMMQELKNAKEKWAHLGLIDAGVGINKGECIVGNIGSYERFDYTAIGDHVNLASRLEGLTKEYGTNIIVSESVYSEVKNEFSFRKLDYVKVKGKKKPVLIYELVFNEESKKKIKTFELALNKYLKKDFKGAIKEFEKINDKASKLFIERSKLLLKSCPKDWDGSFEHKTK